MPPVVVPFYAALLVLLFIALSLRVIRLRRATGVPIGHAGEHRLERSARVHANFAEYVPLALILLGLLEQAGASRPALIAYGVLLVAFRVAHVIGIPMKAPNPFRVAGAAGTFGLLLVAGTYGLAMAL